MEIRLFGLVIVFIQYEIQFFVNGKIHVNKNSKFFSNYTNKNENKNSTAYFKQKNIQQSCLIMTLKVKINSKTYFIWLVVNLLKIAVYFLE